jgi:hypothetical protein
LRSTPELPREPISFGSSTVDGVTIDLAGNQRAPRCFTTLSASMRSAMSASMGPDPRIGRAREHGGDVARQRAGAARDAPQRMSEPRVHRQRVHVASCP